MGLNPFDEINKLKAAIHQGEAVLEVLEHLRKVKVDGKEVDTLPVLLDLFTSVGAHIAGLKSDFAKLEDLAGDEFAELKALLEKKD